MKFHSDQLTSVSDISNALTRAKFKGHVPNHVYADITRSGSRSHKYAYEVSLYSLEKLPGDKRRFKNSGNNGAAPEYAATYDEWGYFMAEIYAVDSFVVMGTLAHGPYRDETEFNSKTNGKYPIEAI